MIITYPLNGIEYSAQDAETYLSSRTSGLFSDEVDFVPSGMTVTISPFLAWIKNTQFSGKSVAVTEPVEVTISPAESVLHRIDRIVLRFSAERNASEIAVLKGVASSSPQGKKLTRNQITYELGLAEVLVPAGATSLSALNVKSTILDEDLCGLMRDGVTRIPTANLYEQVEELLDDLRKELENVENESAYLLKNGSVAMTGNFNNGGFRSENLAAPENANDATNKGYVDNNFLPAKPEKTDIDMFDDAYYQEPSLFGAKRWINPPMKINEEYQTFEFFETLPVYIKAINFGDLPASGYKTMEIVSGENVVVVDFNAMVYRKDTSMTYKFPLITTSGAITGMCYFDNLGLFTVQTFANLSSYECTLIVKYVRPNGI